MAIADVRAAIATALRTISGLEVSEYVKEKISAPAYAEVTFGRPWAGPRMTAGSVAPRKLHMLVSLMVPMVEWADAQKALDTYMEWTGANSVWQVLWNPTLSGTGAAYVDAVQGGEYGRIERSQTTYAMVQWEVVVVYGG